MAKQSLDSLLEIGKEAEDKFEAMLLWNEKKYQRIGQERWLPKWVHGKLRFQYNISIEVLRHIPDFATEKALIQIKHAPDCDDYPTVTLQKSSYEVANFYAEYNIPVLILWLFPDKIFYGNWVKNINPIESKKNRHDLNGSQTPMLLIKKDNLKPLFDFMDLI